MIRRTITADPAHRTPPRSRRSHAWLLLALAAGCGGDEDAPASSTTAAAVTIPVVQKPPVGTLEGTHAVTPDGAATYSLPLEVPAGRAGMQPSLALTYSSRTGGGIAGVGWSLGATSQIAPCGSTLRHDGELRPVQLDAHDRYCLDGARLVSLGGAEYRIESDPGVRILAGSSDPLGISEWTVYARDGRILRYGSAGDARIDAAVSGGSRRIAWMQSEVRDRVGNYMRYTYGQSHVAGTEWWLAQIDYAGFDPPDESSDQGPSRQVLFEYEARPASDVHEQYLAGVKIRTSQRLKQITMRLLAETAPVRQYRLAYEQGALSRRSRLTSIELCDRFGGCLPATRLVYTDAAVSFERKDLGLARFRDSQYNPEQRMVFATDVDGDGRDDLVYREEGQGTPDRIAIRRSLYSALDNPTLNAPEYQTYPEVASVVTPYQDYPERSWLAGLSVYDANGDGSVDVVAERESLYCCGEYGEPVTCPTVEEPNYCTRREPYLHLMTGWSYGSGSENTSYDIFAKQRNRFIAYADFNGDLRPEVLQLPPRHPHASHVDGLVAGSIPLQASAAWRALNRCNGAEMCDGAFGINGGVHPELAQVLDADGDGASDVLLPYVYDPDLNNLGVLRYDLIQIRGNTVEAFEIEGNFVLGSKTYLELVVDLHNGELRPVEMNCSVFADLNGDGLPDLATRTRSGLRVRLNRGGRQFDLVGPAPTIGDFSGLSCVDNHSGPGLRVTDIDQDGRGDLLVLVNEEGVRNASGAPIRILRSTGTGFEPMTAPSVFPGIVSKAWATRTVDINADGLFDVVQVDDAGTLELYVQKTAHVDLLARVDNGYGTPTWGVTYKPLPWMPEYGASQGGPWLNGEPWKWYVGSMIVVAEEQLPSALSTAASPAGGALVPAFRHAYELGSVDTQGEGWLGFKRHTVTDLRSQRWTRTTYTQGETSTTVLGGKIRYPMKALPVEELSMGSGLIKRRKTTYGIKAPAGAPVYFVYPQKVTEEEFTTFSPSWPDSSDPYRWTETTTVVDDFNNPTTVTVKRGAGAVTTTTRTVSNITTNPTNPDDLTRWWIGRVTGETVDSSQGTVVQSRSTSYKYDENTGRVNQIIRNEGASDPSLVLCTTTTFAPLGSGSNSFRLPERVDVTPGGCSPTTDTRTTLTTYDADGTYVIKTTNPEGHVTERLVEPGLGVVYEETEVSSNGIRLVGTSQHDGFGRLVKVTRPDGTWTEVTRDTAGCAPHAFCTTTQTSAGSKRIERADKLGQVVRTVTGGLGGDVWTDVEYDDRGRVSATLQPRYTTGAAYYAARYTYDAAGRVTKICQHDATKCKTTTYSQDATTARLETTVVDEDGKRSVTQIDWAGRLVSSMIYPGTSAATTTYEYGPFDTVTKVTDAKGNIVTMEYDALGRQRKVIDRDLGRGGAGLGWREMDYDAFGQLVTLRDPKGQVTRMTYDRLGRARTRTAPEGTQLVTDEWEWDTAGGAGRGRLARRSREGVSTSFTYDTLGRPQRETWTIDGSVFEYELAYDAQGRLDTLKYPIVAGRTNRFTIKHAYSPSNHLQHVQDASTATLQPIWTATAMDAADRVTAESLGNLRTTTRTYAPETGRLSRVTTPSIHDVEYTYAANGNLASRTDYRNSATAALSTRTETFTYDGANRLLSATVSGRATPTYSYAYDTIGNLTSAADQTSCTSLVYGGTDRGPHQLASATCAGVSYTHQYDANGNETSTRAPDYREQTWTSFDKVLELGSPHGRMRYTYDADHRRVKKERVPGALTSAPTPVTPALNDALSAVWDRTYHVGDLYENRLISGSTTTEHVFHVRAAGRTIAQLTRRGTTESWLYYHADFQGTPERFTGPRTSTGGAGPLVSAASYDAWGMRRNPSWTSTSTFSLPGPTRAGYTGHEHDDEVAGGVVDMGGRTYDAFFKRFTSPDPIVQAPDYGPSWNRYSYVFNNPLRYTDPTGHEAVAFESEATFWDFFAAAMDGGGTITTGLRQMVVRLSNDGRAENTSPNSGPSEAHDEVVARVERQVAVANAHGANIVPQQVREALARAAAPSEEQAEWLAAYMASSKSGHSEMIAGPEETAAGIRSLSEPTGFFGKFRGWMQAMGLSFAMRYADIRGGSTTYENGQLTKRPATEQVERTTRGAKPNKSGTGGRLGRVGRFLGTTGKLFGLLGKAWGAGSEVLQMHRGDVWVPVPGVEGLFPFFGKSAPKEPGTDFCRPGDVCG